MVALYAGLELSLELTNICVVDEEGRMILKAKVASEPDAIVWELSGAEGEYVRVGLEASPFLTGCSSAFMGPISRSSASRRATRRLRWWR